MTLEEIINIVKEKLSLKRFNHSYSVMEKCEELAKLYGVDVLKAKFVGIAHDIAKEMSSEESIKYVMDNNLLADKLELENTVLLHGKIGADICKKNLEFTSDMARAIEMHTTGDMDMSMLDKILFVADFTADERSGREADFFRELSVTNIDKAFFNILNFKIEMTIGKGVIPHPRSINARNELLKNIEN